MRDHLYYDEMHTAVQWCALQKRRVMLDPDIVYVTTNGVMERLGVSRSTVSYWVLAGLVTPVQLGCGSRPTLFHPDEIVRLVESRKKKEAQKC